MLLGKNARPAAHRALLEKVSAVQLDRLPAPSRASAGRRRRGRGALAYGLIAASKPEPTAPTSYATLREFVLPRVAPIEPPSIQQK